MATQLPEDVMWDMTNDTVFALKPEEELSEDTKKFINIYNLKHHQRHEGEKNA